MNKVKSLKPSTRQNLISYTLVIAAFLVIQLLLGQGMLSRSIQGQLVPICCYIVMALSLNLVVGISGELSLGHAGFMSVGAFSGVAAAVSLQGSVGSPAVRLVIAIAVGAVLAAAAGFIVGVPALRLQGDYLAIVTLAFGQIIVNILQCVYLGVDGEGLHFNFLDAELHMEDGISIISGPKGTVSVTRIASFTAGFLLILVTLAVVQNLVNSRAGRAIMAARDNRIAAGSVGVNVTKYKLMAFVTAAALAGAAGALYGLNYSSVAPSKFDYNTSILVLVFVVLGGLGNMWGSIIAAAFLTALPETPAMRGLADYRMLVYAVVL
ncbi:MAG: branched-chain amino acid ABC transporter permease, partial [Oscillospiraceae bacterium]|nr:branched-chain amino acid ABC transporter permease [Oscillospiraceae bacterium]